MRRAFDAADGYFLPLAALRDPGRLDHAALGRIKETASELLPADGRLMSEPTVTANPLLFNDRPTCEIDLYFVHQSQRLRLSVLFVI